MLRLSEDGRILAVDWMVLNLRVRRGPGLIIRAACGRTADSVCEGSIMSRKMSERYTVSDETGLIKSFHKWFEAAEFISRNGTKKDHPNAILYDRMARRGGKQEWNTALQCVGCRPLEDRSMRERRAARIIDPPVLVVR